MLKTGAEHLESLRDGRRVYIGGEPVDDVTAHPAFRNGARSFAMLYDRKRDPENIDAMSFEEDGERYSSWFLMPRTKDDLRKRRDTHRRIASWTHGLLGRSPDHVASFVTGLAMRPDLFDGIRQGFGENMVAYYRHMRENDVCATYTVLPPQGARKPEMYERAGMTVPTLRVTGEDDAGVTLNGMKMLGTSAIFANETWVGNLLPLGPDQVKESITCGVPLNAEGVSIWSRKPFEQHAVSEFDNPLAWRFDETDSMVIFKDVKVPWERVVVHDNAEMSREIYVRSPSHVMGNHQSNIRFLEKLKLILAVARRVTDMNNVGHIPAVQTTLGDLAAAGSSGLEAMIQGQIENCEAYAPGYVNVNRRYMYAALHFCTMTYSQICDDRARTAGRRAVPDAGRHLGGQGSGDARDFRGLLVGARPERGRSDEGAQARLGPARLGIRRPPCAIRKILRRAPASWSRATATATCRGTSTRRAWTRR